MGFRLSTLTAVVIALATLHCAAAYEQLVCISCDAGFYLDQTSLTCLACPVHSTTTQFANATAPTDCVCEIGFTNGTSECQACAHAFYKTDIGNFSCVACIANSNTSHQGSTGIDDCECSAGFTRDDDNSLLPCLPCNPGSFKSVLGDIECSDCPPNHFCPTGATNPLPCPLLSTSSANSDTVDDCACIPGTFYTNTDEEFVCDYCPPGQYSDTAHQSACLNCPADTFYNQYGADSLSTCIACPDDAFSALGSDDVTDCFCNLGYAGDPGTQCTACEPGTYRENANEYICTNCPSGTYNAVAASSTAGACLSCPEDQDSAAGSDSLFDCVCNPGFSATRDGEGWLCVPCPTGQYQQLSNSSACNECGPGTFSTAVEATSPDTCVACSDGRYSLGDASVCTACAVGQWQDLNDPTRHTKPCELCPPNSTHALEASVSVFDCICASGFFADDTASTRVCKVCLPGHFCPGDNTAHECQFNHWSPGGVFPGPCVECAENSRATGPAISSPLYCQCVAGSEGTHDADCQKCAAGKFQPDFLGTVGQPAVSVSCQNCAANSYVDVVGATECILCTGNASSPEGSDSITECSCNPGFYGPAPGPCAVCLAGSFCPGGSTITLCRPHSTSKAGAAHNDNCLCVAGYYGQQVGTVCLRCPPGSYCPGHLSINACSENSHSRAGSSRIEQCLCLPGMWRGCVDTPMGARNTHNETCVVPWEEPCFDCGEDVVCVNNTMAVCPDFSSAPAKSHLASACVCDDGYYDVAKI